MPLDSWVTPDEIAESWPEVPEMFGAHVDRLAKAATTACRRYAPAVDETDVAAIPSDYKLAVIYQMRELHLAGKRTGDSEAVGDAAYPIRVRPLTDTVKQLLRPQQGAPLIG